MSHNDDEYDDKYDDDDENSEVLYDVEYIDAKDTFFDEPSELDKIPQKSKEIIKDFVHKNWRKKFYIDDLIRWKKTLFNCPCGSEKCWEQKSKANFFLHEYSSAWSRKGEINVVIYSTFYSCPLTCTCSNIAIKEKKVIYTDKQNIFIYNEYSPSVKNFYHEISQIVLQGFLDKNSSLYKFSHNRLFDKNVLGIIRNFGKTTVRPLIYFGKTEIHNEIFDAYDLF